MTDVKIILGEPTARILGMTAQELLLLLRLLLLLLLLLLLQLLHALEFLEQLFGSLYASGLLRARLGSSRLGRARSIGLGVGLSGRRLGRLLTGLVVGWRLLGGNL